MSDSNSYGAPKFERVKFANRSFAGLASDTERTAQYAGRLCIELAQLGVLVSPESVSEAVLRADEYVATHDVKGRLK